jgi:hypothetical protein|tara:strand:- start:2621 stop:4057 length:1437 start_codon:yes stop_codon:yes gene_type:complete
MSEEIYVNTGGTFQQPFNDRQPANAQQPYIANAQQPYIANAQTPFTYQNRTPFTYRNPTNAQQPYIANAQQPYPYIANARNPYIANAQQPYPYIANARQPIIANAQQPYPFTYTANARQPYIANARQPSTYNARYPAGYRNPVSAQNPFTYQARYPANAQSPSNAQQPFTYNARTPFTYQVPFTYQARTPVSSQTPVIYDVFGGGSSSTANIESTSDVGQAPFLAKVNTDVGMSANEWWGAASPHMAQNPNSAFAPGNPYYPANPLAASSLQNLAYEWKTVQSQNFNFSFGEAFAQFYVGFIKTSAPGFIYYGYSGGTSAAMSNTFGQNPYYIKIVPTEFGNNNVVDDTWTFSIKYTVQSQSIFNGGTDSEHPANRQYSTNYTAGTFYNLYSGSSSAGNMSGTANFRQFMWKAVSSSNPGNSTAIVSASGLIFTIRASKSGQTTYYTHFIASNGTSAGGHLGNDIHLVSSYGSYKLAV